MSRGPGGVQRKLLAIFERDPGPHSTFKLTSAVYDVRRDRDGIPWLTRAQLSSVRRALGALAKRGAISGSGRAGFADGRQRWATPEQWVEEERRRTAPRGSYQHCCHVFHEPSRRTICL
jgi:hypothetical protein